MPAIGGDAAPMTGAIDALTSGGGQPAAGGAPGNNASGQDQQRAQLAAFMGKLRELDQHIDQVFGEMPALKPMAQQMKALIKQAVQKASQAAPPQTGSSEGVPTASQ
jgi:uncharacterized protein (DUF885 family)